MRKIILMVFAVSMFSANNAQAQFFKKLKEKVTNKVENAVTRNISDKAAREANEALNTIWESDLKNINVGMGDPVDPAEIPAEYKFDWRYTINMKTDAGEMDFNYRLKEGAPYMGIEMPNMENFFMVIDNEKGMSVMFMNGIVRATKLSSVTVTEDEVKNPYENMEFQKIGTKTIMGYTCEGYKAETKDHSFTIYITDDAGIGFNDIYSNQKNIPKGFDSDWIGEDSLLMEMQMNDKKDPSKNLTMTCTGIEKEDFSISKG